MTPPVLERSVARGIDYLAIPLSVVAILSIAALGAFGSISWTAAVIYAATASRMAALGLAVSILTTSRSRPGRSAT